MVSLSMETAPEIGGDVMIWHGPLLLSYLASEWFFCWGDSPKLETINETLPSILVHRCASGKKGDLAGFICLSLITGVEPSGESAFIIHLHQSQVLLSAPQKIIRDKWIQDIRTRLENCEPCQHSTDYLQSICMAFPIINSTPLFQPRETIQSTNTSSFTEKSILFASKQSPSTDETNMKDYWAEKRSTRHPDHMSSYMIPIRARERDIADSKSFRSKGQKNGSLLQIEIKPKDCGLLDFQFEDLTVGCDIDLCDYQPSDLVEFPDCDCLACRDCLKRLFKEGLVGHRSNCPAKCPKHKRELSSQIMVDLGCFSLQQVRTYEERAEEFKTTNPRYCFSCGKFIPVVYLDSNNRLQCTCGKKTCYCCKKASHAGVCAEGKQFYANAKQCPGCNRWWERIRGCNHITCVACRKEFCWVCLKTWKAYGCDCYTCGE